MFVEIAKLACDSDRNSAVSVRFEADDVPYVAGTVHAMGQVQVIHPSDGKTLTLVGEGDFC